jgi:hypothetical protein
MRGSAKASSISSGYILLEHSLCTGHISVFSRMYKDGCPATYSCSSGCTRGRGSTLASPAFQPDFSMRSAACQQFSQVFPELPHQRRTRLLLEAVPRARKGEAGAGEAEMLTSEGLQGPKRADKPPSGGVLTSYLSAKLDGLSGTRPRSCIAFIPRVRRSRSSLLSTSKPVSSLTRSRR